MKKNKNIYILYKVIKDEHEQVKDIEYLKEYNNYNDIQQDTRIHKTNIKKMINNNFLKNIDTFKDYCIIKEQED